MIDEPEPEVANRTPVASTSDKSAARVAITKIHARTNAHSAQAEESRAGRQSLAEDRAGKRMTSSQGERYVVGNAANTTETHRQPHNDKDNRAEVQPIGSQIAWQQRMIATI